MQCNGQSQTGERCRNPSQSGSNFCFFHDDASSTKRREAQRRGGQANGRSIVALPVAQADLSTPAGILGLLTRAANGVCSGRLDPKEAHALGHLADSALKAHALMAGTQQLDRIERLLDEQRSRPADPDEVDRMLNFVPDDNHA